MGGLVNVLEGQFRLAECLRFAAETLRYNASCPEELLQITPKWIFSGQQKKGANRSKPTPPETVICNKIEFQLDRVKSVLLHNSI